MLDRKILEHPTRLKIVLLLNQGNGQSQPLSIRDLQHRVGVESTSTIAWHLEKLIDAGYVIKQKDNHHVLSKEAMDIENLAIPVDLPVTVIKGKIIPKRILLVAFLTTSLIVAAVFLTINQTLTLIFLFIVLGTTIGVIGWEYWSLYKEISGYLDDRQK